MLKLINNFTNHITMYRLVLYFLLVLLGVAMLFGWVGWVPYNPLAILFSAVFIFLVCLVVNYFLAWVFSAVTNTESVYITALILALLITPIQAGSELTYFYFATSASLIAVASKYLLAVRRKHLFNPVALAVAITALSIHQSATWWVGTLPLMPVVLIGGLLLVKKIQRFDLVISFLLVSLLTVVLWHWTGVANAATVVWQMTINSPLLFFALVMLTEPATTPPTRKLRIFYSGLVGLLFLPDLHIGQWYSTPELALVIGNIFSYAVSAKEKLTLKLKEKNKVSNNVYDFIFSLQHPVKFQPGQYLEWTLDNVKSDSRGNRRYFTIASAPTEPELHLGVKFYPKPSAFKQALVNLKVGDSIVAAQRAGDFVMPKNPEKKLAFIAGGIGITPFRSMVKYLIDTKQSRDITLLYSAATPGDIAYQEIFNQAQAEVGLKTFYTVTDQTDIPQDWTGHRGYITAEVLKETVPDYAERIFFLSGPRSMVEMFSKTLKELGVRRSHIKKDFFPGFA